MRQVSKPGTLYVVSVPIGHADDLSMRALRLLGEVTVIASEDPLQTRLLCERHGIHTPLTSYHRENKDEKTAVLLARIGGGDNVALVADAGTPVIADPGRYLIQEAVRAGIPVSPVPGPSAPLAVLAASGLSGDRFLFLGLLPATRTALHRCLDRVSREPGTLLLLPQRDRIERTLRAVMDRLGDRHVVVARAVTTAEESFVRGKASSVLERLRPLPIAGLVTLAVEGYRRKAGARRKRAAKIKQRASGS